MMSDLFTPNPVIKGANKRIFASVIKDMVNGKVIKISPFTAYLRAMGATLSEESTSRYLRFARNDWKTLFGIDVIAEGKGTYRIERG